MKSKVYPNSEFFNSIFLYEDGMLFYRNDYQHKRYAGKRAGRVQKAGYKTYRQVKISGDLYYEHRVVWIMHGGEIPCGMQIDHENGFGEDNRIENLRIVDAKENNRNKRRSARGSKSGLTGVTFDKSANKWKAHIQVDGRHHNLGLFVNKEDAYNARREADVKFGFDVSHGASRL